MKTKNKKVWQTLFTFSQWEMLSEGFEFMGKCYANVGQKWVIPEAQAFEAFLAAEKLVTAKDTGIRFEGNLAHYDAINKAALAFFASLYSPHHPATVSLNDGQTAALTKIIKKCKDARYYLTQAHLCRRCKSCRKALGSAYLTNADGVCNAFDCQLLSDVSKTREETKRGRT